MRHLKYAAGLTALIAGLSADAFAQSEPASLADAAQSTTEDGVQRFGARYFERYNPVTAADMVARVPGFEIDNGEDRRGFGGTAGNVLVNGERPSSKDDIEDQLKRIPAGSVERLELLSGSSANVDVRGQTQLVNVVLRETASASSPTTYVLELRDIQYSEKVGYTVQLTKSFALSDKIDLNLDFQTPNLRGRGEGFEQVFAPDGTLLSYRETYGQPNQQGVQVSAGLKWRASEKDTLNFNGLYRPTWNSQGIGVQVYNTQGDVVTTVAGRSEYDNNYKMEFGGDWEHAFSDSLSAKLIGLYAQSNVDQSDVYETYLTSGLWRTQTIERTTETGERVGRGFLSWKINPAHTVDAGLEGAFNFRDTTLDVAYDFGSGPVPQALAVSDARVEEVRVEPFVTHVWKVSDSFSLESGFVFEMSRITQTGDEEKEREFSYPKPRVIASWQAGPEDQLRFSVERDVSQLDFSQFASSLNVVDAFSILGNPDLEPEKAWKYRAEWEKRFSRRGAVTLAAFYDQVEDVEDLVVIGTGDAYGNLGEGTRAGIEVRGTQRLGFLIPHSELRYSGKWQQTEVTDPITGEERRFAGERDWNYNLAFRQELPNWKSAWGITTSQKSDSYEFKRIEMIRNAVPENRVDLFVETTRFWGVTIRAQASNIGHTGQYRTRTFYQADPNDPTIAPRGTGVLDRTEFRKYKGGPEGTQVFSIRVSGTF
ncbi:MAG: hypothetical protein CMK07_08195 [Ponticaulis sp.]|nr:hypothetical protein [Ponticaulis sp.]